MDAHRAERLSAALREELYELINFQLEDPRIPTVDIPVVELSPDGKRAVVRLSIPGDPATVEQTITTLEHAKSYLRAQLAESLDLYRVPEIRFEAAVAGGTSTKIDSLLRRVRRGRPRDRDAGK